GGGGACADGAGWGGACVGGGLRAARIHAPRWCQRRRRGGGCVVEADGAAAGDGAGGGGCVAGQLETLAAAALAFPLHRLHPHRRRRCRTRSPRRAASVRLPRSPPPTLPDALSPPRRIGPPA
ncbi:unnamed protein product, partial [Urochloa humidicola]